MMKPSIRPHGFTLIELLIGLALASIIIAGAVLTFTTQNRGLQAQELQRSANASARDALLQLETTLRHAGWGVHPRFALDMWNGCISAGACRDRIDGPDELAFVHRNPKYRWRASGENGCADLGGCFDGNAWAPTAVDVSASPRTISVMLAKDQVLERGRIMLATCPLGAFPVMLTLSQEYIGADAEVTLTPNAANLAPYNEFDALLPCHAAPGAGIFLVDRYRYFVQEYDGVPWLMLDNGLDSDGDGTLPPNDADDLIPIARNVEDLQVAYRLNRGAGAGPDSDGDWVIGNTSGAAEEPDINESSPDYSTGTADAARFTTHPANVRGVQLTLTVRSIRSDQTQPASWTGDTPPNTGNRSVQLPASRFRRYQTRSDVVLRNMNARSSFTF